MINKTVSEEQGVKQYDLDPISSNFVIDTLYVYFYQYSLGKLECKEPVLTRFFNSEIRSI